MHAILRVQSPNSSAGPAAASRCKTVKRERALRESRQLGAHCELGGQHGLQRASARGWPPAPVRTSACPASMHSRCPWINPTTHLRIESLSPLFATASKCAFQMKAYCRTSCHNCSLRCHYDGCHDHHPPRPPLSPPAQLRTRASVCNPTNQRRLGAAQHKNHSPVWLAYKYSIKHLNGYQIDRGFPSTRPQLYAHLHAPHKPS